ncbi:glycosyltransferase family 4 protein [Candidatus Gottesmanbacteria bacterium]|nr:glycosyltransferase family 4 protein [Candidatus Gottesmanbacteria bacterium]
MKIVIFDREEIHHVGGLSVYNKRLRQFLLNGGHQVHLFCFENKKTRLHNVLSLPYYWAEKHAFLFLPKENTLSVIRKELKRIKPDLVYYPMGITVFDLFIPSICHELAIPIVGIWHLDFNEKVFNPYVIFIKSIFRAYLHFCKQLDGLLVFSEKVKNFYVARGLPAKKIHIVPNGIDVRFYKPGVSHFAIQKGIKKGILFLGRVTLQKNPEVLLKSFSLLNDSGIKLIIVGDGDLRKNLREEFGDKRIIFTGSIDNEQKKLDIIRACQIFVLPSLAEGMSLALLEAMACGLACITSDAGNHGQILKNAGIVIPTIKLKQELPVILRLLNDHPDFVSLLGKKGRKKAISFYNEEKNFGRLEKIFKKIVIDYKNYPRSWKETQKNETGFKEIIGSLAKKAKKFSADYLFPADT